jgi:Cytochrome bd terminal oxidase subunit I
MKTEVKAEPNDFEARPDRVRAHSNGLRNQRIHAQTQQCLERYAPAHREAISRHIDCHSGRPTCSGASIKTVKDMPGMVAARDKATAVCTWPARTRVVSRRATSSRLRSARASFTASRGLRQQRQSGTQSELMGDMDLLYARRQMGMSLAFHIVFAVIGMAMPVMMDAAEVAWLRTGRSEYMDLAKRWARGTAILFAVGAVSGTVLSFDLGLLWRAFMEAAGPIIGMPFSLEGFAFFLEAIFLGLYLYG